MREERWVQKEFWARSQLGVTLCLNCVTFHLHPSFPIFLFKEGEPSVVVHACNLSTLEAEEGGLLQASLE
jgi:hypothetical protein